MSSSIKTQDTILKNIIDKNKNSFYGKKFSFYKIDCHKTFKKNVPICQYEDLLQYIDREKRGEQNTLTSNHIHMFEKTSGTSSPSKYIPFTKEFLAEMQRATSVWLYDIMKNIPAIKSTSSYWSISPRLGEHEFTEGNLPVGLSDETEYFSWIERIFLKQIMSVNPNVAKMRAEDFRHHTALDLLCDENLGLISVWNPSFLIILLEFIDLNRSSIFQGIQKRILSKARKNLITMELNRPGPISYQTIWPNLKFISSWGDGHARNLISTIREYFPNVIFQGKGLLMTEGVVSIPLFSCRDPLLAINSHFYEFISEEDRGTIFRHHELIAGKQYIPVITTSAGLYRYKTNDVVLISGKVKDVPMMKFIGRADETVDLFGEKLNAVFVDKILDQIGNIFFTQCTFKMMAPVLRPKPHYALFVEGILRSDNVTQMAFAMDEELRKNHHYALCQKLGQLGTIEICLVKDALRSYEVHCMSAKGQRPGDIKFKVIDSGHHWKTIFGLDNSN